MQEDYEVSDINYWVGVKDIKKAILSTKGTLLLIHNSAAFESLADFLNKLPSAEENNVVYISLNKTYEYLKPRLKNVKPKMFIVEGVSSGLFANKKSEDDADYIRPPLTLNNLFEVIETYYRKRNPDYIFVDALSELLNFSSDSGDPGSFFLFSNKLNETLGTESTKLVFFYSENGLTELKNLPKMQVGGMIRMEVYKTRVDWKD